MAKGGYVGIIFVILQFYLCMCVFTTDDISTPEFSFTRGTLTVNVEKTHLKMQLVAIHFSVNEPVFGVEAGKFNQDLSLLDTGYFSHSFPLDVNPGDVVHYWLYVIVEGLGYRLLDQQYRVKETDIPEAREAPPVNSSPQQTEFEAPQAQFDFFPGVIQVTLPASSNVTLAAIHMSINKPIPGVEAGKYNIDLLKKGGKFTSKVHVPWKAGDVIHYWTYFIHRGIGHQKLSQMFRIGRGHENQTESMPREPGRSPVEELPTSSCQRLMEADLLPSTCGDRDEQLLNLLLTDHDNLKVVHGNEAATGQFPWQAQLQIVDDGSFGHHCGGVILSDRIVITAAHCLTKSRKNLQVKVGQHDLRQSDEPGEQTFSVQSVVEHANFQLDRSKGFLNDIAILLLRRNGNKGIVFNSFVRPICLPSLELVLNETTVCFVSGWGKAEPFSADSAESASTVLRGARLAPVSSRYCSSNEVYGGRFDCQRHLCAGFIRGGADACGGDSGGPLACKTSQERWVVAGVVSWGGECGASVHPGVYTRVAHFVDWICRSIHFLHESAA